MLSSTFLEPRRDHLGEITVIFDQVVELCIDMKMAKDEDMFCDGTQQGQCIGQTQQD
jgi:transposase